MLTERFPAFVEPWAQMTLRLSAVLQVIGFATGGSLGAWLAAHLGNQHLVDDHSPPG